MFPNCAGFNFQMMFEVCYLFSSGAPLVAGASMVSGPKVCGNKGCKYQLIINLLNKVN
jgi:hypothetical protein